MRNQFRQSQFAVNISKPNTRVMEEGLNQDLLTIWSFKVQEWKILETKCYLVQQESNISIF